ncbi:MAG: DUF4402 domain-containing protein [Pseudomonadota bacterium]
MAHLLACIAAVFLIAAPLRAADATDELRLTVIEPFTIAKTEDLRFGLLTVEGAGTVSIDAASGERTITGGVTGLGSGFGPAIFTTRGESNGRVRIRIAERKAVLTHAGGTAQLTVRRLRHSLRGNRRQRLDEAGYLTFGVGGRLNIRANQPLGTYEGTFTVEAQYE